MVWNVAIPPSHSATSSFFFSFHRLYLRPAALSLPPAMVFSEYCPSFAFMACFFFENVRRRLEPRVLWLCAATELWGETQTPARERSRMAASPIVRPECHIAIPIAISFLFFIHLFPRFLTSTRNVGIFHSSTSPPFARYSPIEHAGRAFSLC